MIVALFGLITLILASLFIIGAVGYSVFWVACFAFQAPSTFIALLCLFFGMGTIIYSLIATAAVIEKSEKWW